MPQPEQIKVFRPALLGFALFLLLFSSFAEYHAYANNELGETSCAIGLWVQHGETAVFSVVLVSAALTVLFYFNPFCAKAFNRKPFESTASLRAPPYSLL